MSAAHDLLHHFQHVIADLALVTGAKGAFDVEVDGEMLYSKHAEGRHAEAGEVLDLFRQHIVPGVPEYER